MVQTVFAITAAVQETPPSRSRGEQKVSITGCSSTAPDVYASAMTPGQRDAEVVLRDRIGLGTC